MAVFHPYVVYRHDDVGFGGICAWQAQFASVSGMQRGWGGRPCFSMEEMALV